VAKRYDRINAGGACRGNPARGQRNSEKCGGYQNKRLRVRRLHTKQQAGHEAGQRKRSREPEPHTNQRQAKSLIKNHAQNISPPRAQNDAYPISRVRWLTA